MNWERMILYMQRTIIILVAAISFSLVTANEAYAEGECRRCGKAFEKNMVNALTWQLPFSYMAVPASIAARNKCLKGCGYKDCMVACRSSKKSAIAVCKKIYAETKCGMKDRKCRKRVRKSLKQCKQAVRKEFRKGCKFECKQMKKANPGRKAERVKCKSAKKLYKGLNRTLRLQIKAFNKAQNRVSKASPDKIVEYTQEVVNRTLGIRTAANNLSRQAKTVQNLCVKKN